MGYTYLHVQIADLIDRQYRKRPFHINTGIHPKDFFVCVLSPYSKKEVLALETKPKWCFTKDS